MGIAKVVTFTEITPARGAALTAQFDLLPIHVGLDPQSGAIADHDVYASIYNPGKLALLVSWKDANAADAWFPKKIDGIENLRHRKIRVIRDMAGSTAVRRRNSTRMSKAPRPNIPSRRMAHDPEEDHAQAPS